jgi:hypothetical protein
MRNKTALLATVALAALILPAFDALAGNQPMIERRIQELDRQNRQVVGSLPEIPASGRLAVKGRIGGLAEKGRIEILSGSSLSSGSAPLEMDAGGGTYITMRQGLTGKPPLLRPAAAQAPRTTPDGYQRFGDALRRYIRQRG